jgi:hypothetical protein
VFRVNFRPHSDSESETRVGVRVEWDSEPRGLTQWQAPGQPQALPGSGGPAQAGPRLRISQGPRASAMARAVPLNGNLKARTAFPIKIFLSRSDLGSGCS